MELFRRRDRAVDIGSTEIPVPRLSIDGWTLAGTPQGSRLAAALPAADLRELETLLHGVAVHVETPFTYQRAADLLDRAGEAATALAVCESWLANRASQEAANAQQTRLITRYRSRLRSRIAAREGRGPEVAQQT